MKINEDRLFKRKDRIAPHGNEDIQKLEMKTDCCICSPAGIRKVLMFAAMFGWKSCHDDALTEFMQTGDAKRSVYVIPPKECKNRRFLWLLLTACCRATALKCTRGMFVVPFAGSWEERGNPGWLCAV